MTFCIRGKELLMDLQKSDWLPIYDDEGIRQTLTEVLDLIGKMEAVNSRRESLRSAGEDIEDSERVEMMYYIQCYRRNLRYLLAYFLHRLKKMRSYDGRRARSCRRFLDKKRFANASSYTLTNTMMLCRHILRVLGLISCPRP